MKSNLPVTNNEVPYPDGEILVSKTDLKGVITYANPAFIEISGFSERELMGKSHNVVRHPDMPPAAFEDLWDTLKDGRPWTNLVKNRAKSGDYYWVVANVTPIREGGHVVGYMSVRNKPTREQIENASSLYRRINEGKAKLREVSTWEKINMFKKFNIKQRLIAVLSIMAVMLLGVGGYGLYGINKANESARTIYEDRLIALEQVTHIDRLILANRLALAVALVTPTPDVIRDRADQIDKNIETIGDIWKDYMATYLTPEEKILADKFAEDRKKFVMEGLKPAVAALRAGNIKDAQQIVVIRVRALYEPVKEATNALIKLQSDVAKQDYAESQSRYSTIRAASSAIVIIGLLLVAFIGLALIKAIVSPLSDIIGYFGRIAEGNYDNKIDISRNDELGKVMQSLQSMQVKLNFDINESRRVGDEALRIKIGLDNATTNVMIADNNGNIIYCNRAVMDMFKKAAADIRQVFAGFDADKLLGTNFDTFHKNPAHQRGVLKSLSTTHRATIKIGNSSFNLAANPVINERGERLGTCVEWLDITAELKVQDEINQLINAAASGDLARRLPLEDKQGFMLKLGEGMNELLEVLASAMSDISVAIDSMSKGDLTVSITKDYQGTFGKLKDDINATASKLTEVVSNIKESADLIKTASMEISMGNTNLSQRTQEQASALEETASSMEEMTSTVKQNADNAKQANQLVGGARTQAQQGGEVVTKAVGAMEAISGSSKKIADIIGVIDEIAFQTNLLALNAAVEAARAGEQGRGFAVVATEVRNLAQRSAEAAKEIKDLINDSVDKVANGSALVDSSGQALSEIVTSVKKISDIVSEITSASQEQASGIEQVNKAVMQMDDMTQQNAALVEQAAAASKSMEEQAVQLAEQVQFFKMTGNDTAKAPVRQIASGSVTLAHKGNGGSHPARATAPAGKAAAPRTAQAGSRPAPAVVAKSSGKTASKDDAHWDEF
jgi:methyl-accepting chemotaxis protein